MLTLFKIRRAFDELGGVNTLGALRGLDYGCTIAEWQPTRDFMAYAYPIERMCVCYEGEDGVSV